MTGLVNMRMEFGQLTSRESDEGVGFADLKLLEISFLSREDGGFISISP